MIERGIWTSKADFELHFLPFDRRAYWFPIVQCQLYIERHNLPVRIGRSKDGSPTGEGYLIPKRDSLVSSVIVADRHLEKYEWGKLTDRECGLRGQEIVLKLFLCGEIFIPIQTSDRVLIKAREYKDQDSQNDCMDIKVRVTCDRIIEVKCERIKSENLFVQKGELNHRVHLIREDSGRIGERFTPIPDFQE
jgi:hypothetical protein